MAEFTVNPKRFDPKNFKFRIKWDGRYVAGISKISGLRRTTDALRGVLERTRGDLTTTLRQEQLTSALASFEARLGIAPIEGARSAPIEE